MCSGYLVVLQKEKMVLDNNNQSKKHNDMALIKTVRGIVPKMGSNCFLAENATVVGDIVMGNN